MKMTDETILSTPPKPADARVREIGYLVCCPDGCIAQKDALNVQFKGCFVERDTFPQSNAGKSARAIASLSPQVGEEETARTIPDVHESSCARHNEPAYPAGECNCDGPKKAWLAYEKRELERYTALQNNWLATELADVERQPNRQEPSPALPVQGEEIGTTASSLHGSLTTGDQGGEIVAWQPIETAPKTGEFIWLSNGNRMRVGYWYVVTKDPSREHWADMAKVEARGRADLLFAPTHWMPLPHLPSNGQTDDRAGVGTGHSPIVKQSSSPPPAKGVTEEGITGTDKQTAVPCAANVLPQEGS